MVGVVVIYQELRTHVYVSGNDLEPGEIQEVDMQAQADNIRTVFNDPTNFNVKVRCNFVNPSAIPPSRWSRVHSFVVLTMWAQ